MSPRLPAARSSRFSFSLALAASFLLAGVAAAAPTIGYVEDWPGTSLDGWGGGSIYSNPGTGGVGGAGDGYLVISTATTAHLGGFSTGSEYAGDWLAAGITRVRFSLKDVGLPQALEIHFGIGTDLNFWQYNTGFVPIAAGWIDFEVNMDGPLGWTRIIGTGSFPDALRYADRILLRHDRAPFFQTPDAIKADFGVDHLQLLTSATPVAASSWGRLKALYR